MIFKIFFWSTRFTIFSDQISKLKKKYLGNLIKTEELYSYEKNCFIGIYFFIQIKQPVNAGTHGI